MLLLLLLLDCLVSNHMSWQTMGRGARETLLVCCCAAVTR